MEQYHISYLGELRTECRHSNGTLLYTDAPKDNQGKGELYSPTDLLAVSLGSCMLTIMAITARQMSVDLLGMQVDVQKEMAKNPPRRIGRISIRFHCPSRFTETIQAKLESAAKQCPVHYSLHPDIKQDIEFVWGH